MESCCSTHRRRTRAGLSVPGGVALAVVVAGCDGDRQHPPGPLPPATAPAVTMPPSPLPALPAPVVPTPVVRRQVRESHRVLVMPEGSYQQRHRAWEEGLELFGLPPGPP